MKCNEKYIVYAINYEIPLFEEIGTVFSNEAVAELIKLQKSIYKLQGEFVEDYQFTIVDKTEYPDDVIPF